MSDIWGRKVFLLITVFFTCLPIPLMRINPMWYFAMISISGLFAVTFSVVFAYVADVTDETNRTTAYGLVSATFAASLITSPALGSYLSRYYSENFVIALATAISVFDLFFILIAVPESLPEKLRERSKSITWENVDPFKSLKIVFADRTIMLLCITVFFSYLPEAGQFSCFFIYLKLIIGFSQQQVAYYIAYVGILSCISQAVILVLLIKYFGSKKSIIIGLGFQVVQLSLYAFAAQSWLIWFSGFLAALSSIGYPAISAYISNQSHADSQGVSQGMITGIRGLCNGIGPALYGFIFWVFNVNLNEIKQPKKNINDVFDANDSRPPSYASQHLLPGPPFLFGAILALLAIFVTCLITSTKYKPISLLSQRSNKEPTLVKIGNSSSTYNRSSSSTLGINVNTNNSNTINSNLLSSHIIASTSDLNDLEENQMLLADEYHVNIPLISPNQNVTVAATNAGMSSLIGSQLLPNVNNQDHQIAQNSLNNHLSSIFYPGAHGTLKEGSGQVAGTSLLANQFNFLNEHSKAPNKSSALLNELAKGNANPAYSSQYDAFTQKSTKSYDNSMKYSSKVNLD